MKHRAVLSSHMIHRNLFAHDSESFLTSTICFVFLYSALKQIREHLHQGHHKKALAVLKAAMITWPENSMFVTPDRDEEQKEDGERYMDSELQYSLTD